MSIAAGDFNPRRATAPAGSPARLPPGRRAAAMDSRRRRDLDFETCPCKGTEPVAEPSVQRRLAAILAADVVEYARLMEADEAGTLARLQAVRRDAVDPAIADHRGRLVKLIGDGALVEFASAVDAVHCALAI
jgi:class 3 adenylate cyclase